MDGLDLYLGGKVGLTLVEKGKKFMVNFFGGRTNGTFMFTLIMT